MICHGNVVNAASGDDAHVIMSSVATIDEVSTCASCQLRCCIGNNIVKMMKYKSTCGTNGTLCDREVMAIIYISLERQNR